MRANHWIFSLMWLLLFPWHLFAKECSDYFVIKETDDSYIINVFDTDEDDLSLEARLLLYTYIKKKEQIKGNFTLKLKNFLVSKEFECPNGHHEIYVINKKDVNIVKLTKEEQYSYKSLKRVIYAKIAQIETKEEYDLKDLYTLYNLYFSLGKIESSNKIMEKIFDYKMKGGGK